MTDIFGDAFVKSSFNPVKLINIRGKATVDNKSGSVYLENIDSDANVNSSFNAVELFNIGGDAEVECQSGRVVVEGAENVRVKTSFNQVSLRDIKGNVMASTSSGSIKGELNFNPKAVYDMESSFGDIRLTFIGKLSGRIRATVPSFNEIDTGNIEVTTNRFSKNKLSGTIGKENPNFTSGFNLILNVKSSGNIYLRQKDI